MAPKTRSLVCISICILSSFFIRIFTDLNLTIIIYILLFVPGFILSYILSIKLDIRLSHILFYIIFFCSMLLFIVFEESDTSLNISINDWEKTVLKKLGNKCSINCKIENRAIYDENNNEVYKWYGLSYVYDGQIRKENNFLEYKISLENKCIIKELNKEHKILNGKCN